ncbi:MAG: hypothetical protein GY863_20625 [bacterium]|nr:hypothetical protein [bacterium]
MLNLVIKFVLILSLSNYALVFGISRDGGSCEETPIKNSCGCGCSEPKEELPLQTKEKKTCECFEALDYQVFLKFVYLTVSPKKVESGSAMKLITVSRSVIDPEQKDSSSSTIHIIINPPPKLFLLKNSLLI